MFNQKEVKLFYEEGRKRFFGTMEELADQYLLYNGEEVIEDMRSLQIVGKRIRESHREYLLKTLVTQESLPERIQKDCRRADLKEIMYYVEEQRIHSHIFEAEG